MTNEQPIDFGDVFYLAQEPNSTANFDEEAELYLVVIRDTEKTLRKHGKIFVTPLERGDTRPAHYCVEVIDGQFVNLKADPEGATVEQMKKLKFITRIRDDQKEFFLQILESIEARFPGSVKFNED